MRILRGILALSAIAVLAACNPTLDPSASTGPSSPVTSASTVPLPRRDAASAWPAPNQRLTPGAIVPGCTYPRPAYERNVTSATRRAVLIRYHHSSVSGDELDHRVPFALCGADSGACKPYTVCQAALDNLWPEPYDGVKVSAFVHNYKDKLEDVIADKVRLGLPRGMTLAQGQAVFLGDWREGYCHYVDPSPCASR